MLDTCISTCVLHIAINGSAHVAISSNRHHRRCHHRGRHLRRHLCATGTIATTSATATAAATTPLQVYPRSMTACAMLYFTGSDYFNRSMRWYAGRKGMTLSDKGLCPCTRDARGEVLHKHS
jgi:DNA polymerase/3'-5' exonuclease PolX